MPCRSDYMESNDKEKESKKVLDFLSKELDQEVGEYDSYYGRIKTIDEDVAALCTICKVIKTDSMSLELQIWWRDHQKADKEREKYKLDKLNTFK